MDLIHEDVDGDGVADLIHEDVDKDGTIDLVHEDSDGDGESSRPHAAFFSAPEQGSIVAGSHSRACLLLPLLLQASRI